MEIGGVPWKVSEEDEGDSPPRKGVIQLDAKVMEKDAEEVIKTSPVVPKKDLLEHGRLPCMQGHAQGNGKTKA